MDLRGKTTEGGWLIGDPVSFSPDHTGGYFSCCYFASKDGKTAFLKALNIEKFDTANLLNVLACFDYEKSLVEICNNKRLRRVVLALETGHIEHNPGAPPALRKAPYIIFEKANGDIRKHIDISKPTSSSWKFSVLHQTTLGLLQLHGQAIAHQDLKPSNVLVFDNSDLKIADLGRSSLKGRNAPHDHLPIPGARNYATFEQRYSWLLEDWVQRRLATDVFHLGCLTVFSFTNICLPQHVMMHLDAVYQPRNWGSTYPEVLPHIKKALIESVDNISKDFPSQFTEELINICLDLCDPDPHMRGQAGRRKGAKNGGLLWLERYASKFDLLAKKAKTAQAKSNA